MKKVLLAVAAVILFVTVGVTVGITATVSEVQSEGSRQTGPVLDDMLPLFDLDGNGLISENEAIEAVKGHYIVDNLSPEEQKKILDGAMAGFKAFDKNKDGWLDYSEARLFFGKMMMETTMDSIDEIDNHSVDFLSLEETGSGEGLEEAQKADEGQAKAEEQPKAFDTNGLMLNVGRAQAGEIFFQTDKNRDGVLDKAEFKDYFVKNFGSDFDVEIQKEMTSDEAIDEHFNEIDTDQNGTLSRDEFIESYVSDMLF